MSQLATITELDILSDAIAPDDGGLVPAAAESILKWKFPDRSIARMNELSRRNREGRLTPEEQDELSKYMLVGDLINLAQAKARLSLKSRTSA